MIILADGLDNGFRSEPHGVWKMGVAEGKEMQRREKRIKERRFTKTGERKKRKRN